VVPQNQNVVIDQVAQTAAAQLAQQILADTNVTLKQEIVKIPDFWGEKGKDTVTVTQFISSIDKCQVSNKWNDATTFANFSLSLRGDKFLLTQVFQAAALEWVCKLLSHKEQKRLTVKDAYQTYFTDHRVETDKKENRMNVVNIVNEDDHDNSP
jgi:hypothetical protein